MARRNLVARPSFENGLTGWTNNTGNALTREQSSSAPAGGWFATVSRATAGQANVYQVTGQAVTGGSPYVGSVFVSRDGTSPVYLDLDWIDASGTYLSSSTATLTPSSGVWTRLSVAATAPSTAATVKLFLRFPGMAAGAAVRVDAAMLEPGSTLGSYADGDTAGWRWDGTAYASASRQVEVAERNECPSPYGVGTTWSVGTSGTGGVGQGDVAVSGMDRPVGARATQGNASGNLRIAPPARIYDTDQGGKSFTARIQVRHSAARSIALEMTFRNASGGQTGTITSSNVTAAAGGTYVLTFTATAPAGTYRVQPTVLVRNAGAGESVLATACRTVEGSVASLAYADGDTAGWRWEGATGTSTSTTVSDAVEVDRWQADTDSSSASTVGTAIGYTGTQRELTGGGYDSNPAPIPVEAAPGYRPGRACVHVVPSGYRRVEHNPDHRDFGVGDDYFFSFAFYLSPDFPTDLADFQVIEQLHGAPWTGSPVVAFEARDGQLRLTGGANRPGASSPGQYAYDRVLVDGITRARWYSVVYRVVFSDQPGGGRLDVWVDGQPLVTAYAPPCGTVYGTDIDAQGGRTYRKSGWYRRDSPAVGTLYVAGAALGGSYAQVDPARALTAPVPRSLAIGRGLEQGTATPLARTRRRDVGQAAPEADTAAPVVRARRRAIGQAFELDQATPLGRARPRPLGQAVDTSSASSLAGRSRRRSIGQAFELDVALPVSARKPGEARTAREYDVTFPVGRAHRRDLGQAAPEADQAAPVGRVRVRSLGQAVDSSSASSLVRAHRRDLGQAFELDLSLTVGRTHTRALGQAAELDTAPGIANRSRRRSFGQALEADTARPVGRRHRRDIGQAQSFEVALQLAQSTGAVSEEAYGRAIAAADRTVYGTLRVDWRGDAFASPEAELSDVVSSLEIERSLDGDLPEGAGLIDGFATATLKATLGGHRKGARMPLAAELSPFRPDATLAGVRKSMRAVEASIGVVTEEGPKATRLFSGPSRLISIDEGGSSVTLDADDPSERMRALATLPTYGEFVTHANRRAWKLTVNSQAVVDYCARRCGIFASPPPRPEAIIVATGHGGLFAERGFNGAPISIYGSGPAAGLWTEDGHPYGMLGTPESPSGGTVGYQEFYGTTDGVATPVRFEAGNGVGASLLLHAGSYQRQGSVENRVLQIRITEREYPRLFLNVRGDGALYAGLSTSSSSIVATPWITTGSSRWRFVGVHYRWTSNTTLVVTLRVDGQTRTYTLTVPAVTITPTPFFGGYRPILQVNAGLARAWSNLQVWPGYQPPPAGEWQGERWTSQADIGRGNNELVYLPDVAAEEAWTILKAVTSAEYAVHGFTEFGRYYWRPRTDVRAERVDHVLDVDANLAEVAYSYGSDTIRNSVGVTTTAAYHSGELQTVVKAEDVGQFIIPAGTTKVFRLDWPHGAAGYQGGILQYHYQEKADTAARDKANGFPMWSGDVAHGWTYSSIGASGGWTILDNDRSVVIRYVQTAARKVEIRVSNPGPGPIRLATAATLDNPDGGEPAMRIGGWPLEKAVDRVTTWTNEKSILELGGRENGGERAYPIPSSEWRQDDAPIAPVARDLLAVLDRENPVLEDLPCRGDPRVRAGNVARGRFRDGGETIGTVVRTRHVLDVEDGRYRTLVSLRPLPVALQTLPTPAPDGWTFYVDISRYQGDRADTIDLARVRDAGYAGCVAKIGQGAGSYTANGSTTTYAASLDPWWSRFRDEGLGLWPQTFAGYWYVGSTEAPADQAARCLAAIGDTAIPVMLDWEAGSGSWQNLLNVLAAFRSAGLTVTMLYTNMQSYAPANGASSIDSTGLALVNSRYWISSSVNPAQDPGAVWADVQATRPTFGFESSLGGTVDALQFTDAGVVYPGMAIDVNAFPGTPAQLAAMFHGDTIPTG